MVRRNGGGLFDRCLCLFICCYPVYNISATVLIKDDKKGGSSNNVGGLDELGLNGLITSSQSIDNEIEVLRSKTLVKKLSAI